MPSTSSNISSNTKHNVTIYSRNGSQTIKDPNNTLTQCALKPLIGGECAKDSTDTKYTSYRIRKGEDKFNTIISCSNHNVCDDGANFNETFAKLTQIARKAKPEEGFPGVGASAMFNGNTTSQVEKNSYAKKSGGISLVPRTQKEIEESDSEEDVVLFKGRDTASTVSNNTTNKQPRRRAAGY